MHNRTVTLFLSIIGMTLLCIFLFSPVLLLPADPAFGRLTLGESSVVIDGKSWIPIFGLHLVLKLTTQLGTAALILFATTTAAVMFLSPFIAFMHRQRLLVAVVISTTINLLGIGIALITFKHHLEMIAFGAGVGGLLLLLGAIYSRIRALNVIVD